jgi:predicted nucleic acid-binding protein
VIIVLDTSAGAEIVLKRGHALALGEHIAEAEWVVAPTLYIPEITNEFWKYFRFSNMPVEECEKAIELAVALPDDYVHEETLYKEAFALACTTGRPVYDVYYLVLARRNNAYLLTMDASLQKSAKENSIRVLTL